MDTKNRKQMADLSGTHIYDYDDLNRLTQVTYPNPPSPDNYTYDANGNRKTKNGTTYDYDAADQMTWDGTRSYTYDPNGNQTGRGSDVFTYDHENRLTKVLLPDTVSPEEPCYDVNGSGNVDISDVSEVNGHFGEAEPFYDLNNSGFVDISDVSLVNSQFGKNCASKFTYNGDGLRTARAGSWLNWKYVWDVASGLPVILKENDSHNAIDGHGTDTTYVYGLDLISVTDRLGYQSYFLYDGLGSISNITDGSGNTTATYRYDVFGSLRFQEGPGASTNEWRFTGQQRDPQTNRNLYYLRARYYDPAIGRFLTRDPIPGELLYPYAGNNPVNFADPRGTSPNLESASAWTATGLPRVCKEESTDAQIRCLMELGDEFAKIFQEMMIRLLASLRDPATLGQLAAGVGLAICTTGAACFGVGVVYFSFAFYRGIQTGSWEGFSLVMITSLIPVWAKLWAFEATGATSRGLIIGLNAGNTALKALYDPEE